MKSLPWHGIAVVVGGLLLFGAGFYDLEFGRQLGANADQALMLAGIGIVTGPGVFIAGQNAASASADPAAPAAK